MTITRLPLRVCYLYQEFVSFKRAATDYIDLLHTLCDVVDDPQLADVVILHFEPSRFPRLLSALPVLQKKYLIGNCVWEADKLPRQYDNGVRCVDEVWTPSAYSYGAFCEAHKQVYWMPHLVERDRSVSFIDNLNVAGLIDRDPNLFNFFVLTDDDIKRKNIAGLLRAFRYVNQHIPHARLIIKTIKHPARMDLTPDISTRDNVTTINGYVSHGTINALYNACQVYVSAHCSEGWGFGLSDAMLMYRPLVATGYSGSMDFTTSHNALLVEYSEELIQKRHAKRLFSPTMRWAYPHQESLERQMLQAYKMSLDGSINQLVHQAAQDISRYDRPHVSQWLSIRIQELHARAQENRRTPRSLKRHPFKTIADGPLTP